MILCIGALWRFVAGGILAAGLLAACSPAEGPAPAPTGLPETARFTPAQAEDIGAIIRAYLIANPEVLEEAFQALQDKRMAEAMTAMTSDPRAFSLGPSDAPITIIEFFDYQCTFCHQAMAWVFATQRARNDVRVVFMELPSLGPQSVEAAKAAIASMRQGKYLGLHQALMSHRGPLDAAVIDRLAVGAGVDVARMRRDMGSPEIEDLIADTHEFAARIGGQGTPLFVINGRIVAGFDERSLSQALREAAEETRT